MDSKIKTWLITVTIFLVGCWFMVFCLASKSDEQAKENHELKKKVESLHNDVMGIIGSVD